MSVAVIDFEEKRLSLFGDGRFQFRRDNTIVHADEIADSQEYVKITGEVVPMVEILDLQSDDDNGYYTREELERFKIKRQYEDFEHTQKEFGRVKMILGFFPWVVKETREVAVVPNGNYGAREEDRFPAEVKLPKAEYTIFDYRTDTDDK